MPSGAASYGSANPAPSRMARSASKPFRPALQLNAPVGFSCHFLLPSTCVPLLSIPLVFSPLRALCPTERLQLLCCQRIAHPFPCNGECASFFLPLSDLLTTEKEDSMSRTEEILKRIRSIVARSEEHTSELQSPDTISYAVFCLTKKKKQAKNINKIYFTKIKTNKTNYK